MITKLEIFAQTAQRCASRGCRFISSNSAKIKLRCKPVYIFARLQGVESDENAKIA